MTRVEKFHTYRQEIANMKVEEFSVKSETSKRISEITRIKSSSKLDYDEIMSPLELFEKGSNKNKKLYRFKPSLDQILYVLVGLILVGTLICLIVLFK